MITRKIHETVTEYDIEGRKVRETVTETEEQDDNVYWTPITWASDNGAQELN